MADEKWEVVGKQADEWEVVGGDRSSVKSMLLEAGRQVGNIADRTQAIIRGGLGADVDFPEPEHEVLKKLFSKEKKQKASEAVYKAMEGRVKARDDLAKESPVQGNLERFGAGAIGLLPQLAMGPIVPAVSQAAELTEQGVAPDAANKAAMITAGINAAQMAVPIARPVAGTLASPVAGAAGDYATRKYLEGRGYGKEAQQFDPTDPVARALDLLGAAPFGAHQAVTQRARQRRERALAEQDHVDPNIVDPLTKGASPAVTPWEPSKGQQRLDLGDGPPGVKNPTDGYYEGGLPADAYLKGRFENTGQGDLFAGTRPYENPAIMRAAELERSLQDGVPTKRTAPDTLDEAYPTGVDPASTLAMRSDLTMGDNGFDFQHRRTQAEGLPYEKVDRVAPTRQPELEGTNVKPFEPPPNELTAMGKAGERHLQRLEDALRREEQAALTRDPSNPTMTRDMFPVGNGRGLGPIGKRNSGALNLGAIFGWDKPGKPRSVANVIAKEGSEQALAKFSSIFDGHAIFKAAQATLNKSPFQKLMWVSPDSFLRLAYPLGLEVLTKGDRRRDSSAYKLNRVRNALNKDLALKDLPYLEIDNNGKVQSHEGRHRMMTFKRKGLDLVPLMLNFQDPRLGLPSHITPEGRGRNTPLVLSKHLKEVFPETDGADIPTKSTPEQFPTADGSGQVLLGNGGFITPEFKKKTFDFVSNFVKGSEKNTVDGLKSAAELYALDRRPVEEVGKAIDPKSAEDIGEGFRFVLNGVDADGVARDTKNYKGTGQAIKWLRDQFKLSDRTATAKKEDLLNGTKFLTGLRGFDQRTISDKSPIKLAQDFLQKDWQAFYKDLAQPWFQANKDGVEPRLKPEAKAIYDQWQGVFQYLREHMNQLRSELHLPPIPKAEGFFPGMRVGDWVVNWKDANGQLIGSQSFESRGQANSFRKELMQNKEYTVSETEHRRKSLHDMRNAEFSVLEIANNMLKDQPDVQAMIHKSLSQASQRRGFGGKHSLESKHLLGAMGTTYSKQGMIDMIRAFEMYTEKSLDYIADLEKKATTSKLLEELNKNPELKIPQTKALINDMYLNSIGAFQRSGNVTDTVNMVARQIGWGEQGLRNRMQAAGTVTGAWVLFTSSFFLSQFVQAVSAGHGLAMSHGGGLVGAAKAPLSMATGILKTFNPDALDREGLTFAAKNGYINSDWAELLNARYTKTKDTLIGEFAHKPVETSLRGFSFLTNVLEKEGVRIPYFLMQLDAFKGQIKDKQQLFEAAGEQTQKFMVDYRRQNEAMVFNKTGVVGDALRPLKRFSTNLLGQVIELLQTAKKGDVAPLATMLLSSYLLAGLAGNMASQTIDDLVRYINIALGKDIPTVREMVMMSDSTDVGKFGIMSSALGADVSSSVAQNSVKGMLSVPIVEVPWKMTKESFNYLSKSMAGKETSADLMKFLLAVSPPSMREIVRNRFVENGIVPDPNHDMEATYTRSQKEQEEANIRAWLIGRPSLTESRQREITKAAREAVLKEKNDRSSSADKLADTIIAGKEITPDMIKKYMDEGGDPSKISDLVKRRIIVREFNYIDQQFMKKGVGGANIQELLKDHKKAQDWKVEKQQFSPEDKHFEAYKQSRPQRPPISDLNPPTFHEYLNALSKKYPNNPGLEIEEPQESFRGPRTIDPRSLQYQVDRLRAMRKVM